MTLNYFGVNIRENKHGLKLTRENYAVMNPKSSLKPGKIYSPAWRAAYLEKIMENFDLNRQYFSLLDRAEFLNAVIIFLKKHKRFTEVKDLNLYSEKPGYYMMVLEAYCQVYIGTAANIKRRIQQHWSKVKPFDRLLFPMNAVNTSLLSIDSFKAYDTTRIYAYAATELYSLEDSYLSDIPSKFLCNRMSGGQITEGLPQAIGMMKQRQLTAKDLKTERQGI